jgi:RNA polymerase sigma-70 factor (ECF subfamily)
VGNPGRYYESNGVIQAVSWFMAVIRRLPNAATIDDAALARLAAEKDPRAAAALWDRYATLVRGILRRTLGPVAEVEDLVQEVFIGMFRTLGGLRDPEALRSFVVGTAIRTARSELRRKRVRRWLSLTPTGTLPDAEQTVGLDPEARRAVKRLYEVLDTIDDRGRMAFVLRYMEGYELTEVAEALGCSLATTKRALAKAQDRVNAMVKRDPLLAPYARQSEGAAGTDDDGTEVSDAAQGD